ncbi:Uncharacterised protein [Klebsiella pneumoniae]|nr:Uncharacterised protein [Klebsiella pneumoniae]
MEISGPGIGAVSPAGDHDKLWSQSKPTAYYLVFFAGFGKPREVLIGKLDDIRQSNHPHHARQVFLPVLDEDFTNIGVEEHHPARRLSYHQRFINAAARFGYQADASEQDGRYVITERRQVAFSQHSAGAILIVKGIARLSAFQPDKGQRGR